MSFGEVDTLNMLFDKLESLFDESQGYYETFLDTNNMYKKGQLSDKEFFQKLGDYVVAYSALEFLAIKVIFEMRKAIGFRSWKHTVSRFNARNGKSWNDGRWNGSATKSRNCRKSSWWPSQELSLQQESFGDVGTLPSPDPEFDAKNNMLTSPSGNECSSCRR